MKYTVSNQFETFGSPCTETHASLELAELAARRFAADLVEMVGSVHAGVVTIEPSSDAQPTGYTREIAWWNNLRDAAGAEWDSETETGTNGTLSVEQVIVRLLNGPVTIEESEVE